MDKIIRMIDFIYCDHMKKYLECPKCGHYFKKPVMDQSYIGFGLAFPGLGLVRCPNCREKARRNKYRVLDEVPAGESAKVSSNTFTGVKPDVDLVEDSKYEDE